MRDTIHGEAMAEALGVDLGGVIVPRLRSHGDTTLEGNYLEIEAIPGAFEVLRALVERRFGHRVFVVSKAGPRTRVKSQRWLRHHRFHSATAIKPRHVHYCLERQDKAPLCERPVAGNRLGPASGGGKPRSMAAKAL